MTLAARFWGKVDQGGPDECWPWKASCDQGGYGKFSIARSTWTAAHRVAHALAEGRTLPNKGDWILHRCDNPPCCNPAHLYQGTPAQNSSDAVLRSRLPGPGRGTEHPRGRLSDADVVALREAVAGGQTTADVAETFGLTHGSARDIAVGRKRLSAGGPLAPPRTRPAPELDAQT